MAEGADLDDSRDAGPPACEGMIDNSGPIVSFQINLDKVPRPHYVQTDVDVIRHVLDCAKNPGQDVSDL